MGRDRDRECAHYDVTDAQGAHLGCRVDLAALLPTHHVTVTVTGGGASCSDISVDLQRVGERRLCACAWVSACCVQVTASSVRVRVLARAVCICVQRS